MVEYHINKLQLEWLYQLLGAPDRPIYEEGVNENTVFTRILKFDPNSKLLHFEFMEIRKLLVDLTRVVDEMDSYLVYRE